MGTVLIIDDSPYVRTLLGHILSKEHEVIQAVDGLQALEILCQVKPKVILMDIVMPKMNGYQTLLAIRNFSDLDDVKIAIVTSNQHNSDDPFLKSLEGKADAFFTKPVKIDDIKSWVSNQM